MSVKKTSLFTMCHYSEFHKITNVKLSLGGLVVLQRIRRNRIQNFQRHHLLYFCYSFLYYCTTNLIFDRHIISILAPRYMLHEHIFCSLCLLLNLYHSGEMSKRHLVECSGRSNNIFTAISSEISTWMIKEMFRIKSGKNFKEHTSTSFSRRLIICLITKAPSNFFTWAQSCSWWEIRKKKSDSIPFRRHVEKTLRGR